MALKSEAELRQLMVESERLWNDGDRDAWLQLWRTAVPGEHVLEMPVGSEPRRGFDAARSAVWDEMQPAATIHNQEMIICNGAVAALTKNIVTVEGQTITVMSIDTYEFDESGNCYERNYFAMPR
jgi:hypothetical protein